MARQCRYRGEPNHEWRTIVTNYVSAVWVCWRCFLRLYTWDAAASAQRNGCPKCSKKGGLS